MKVNIITIITLMVFALAPVVSVSADMWDETPGVFDESPVAGSGSFNYNRPAVNLWAETPDLNADSETYELVLEADARINGNKVIPECTLKRPI